MKSESSGLGRQGDHAESELREAGILAFLLGPRLTNIDSWRGGYSSSHRATAGLTLRVSAVKHERTTIATRERTALNWRSLCSVSHSPRSSNGRTAAFGAVNRGSNPCRGAIS